MKIQRKFYNKMRLIAFSTGIILLSVFYFLFSPVLHAASIRVYFSAPLEIMVGQEFSVRLLADSDQPLNAYSLNWIFQPDKFELINFSNANSIIDVWQDQPIASASGAVEFDGGSLRPFVGIGGELLEANFKALESGEAEFGFRNTAVFLANGKGTKVVPAKENLRIQIKVAEESSQPGSDSVREIILDKTPPAVEFLSLEADPFNKGQKLLGFLVKDEGVGIKKAEARFRSSFFWSDWQAARNPTAVPVSAWAVGFRVVDNKGNLAERTIYDWVALGKVGLWPAIIVAMAAVFWAIIRRRGTRGPINI